MKTLFGFGTVAALAMAAVACGGSPEESTPSTSLEVTGTVDTRLRSLDNASAVAIGSDGRTFSAYLQKNGSFKLDLPVGHTYRVLIANSTMNGELRTIGHLVNKTSDGRADEIVVKDGGKMNLGALRPAGASANPLKTACDCNEGGGYGDGAKGGDKAEPDEDGDFDKGGKGDKYPSKDDGDYEEDYKSKPKDSDKDRICEDESDVELEAENAPGDKCKKGSSDKPAPKPTKKACSTKDVDKDGKDDGDYDKKGGGDSADAPDNKDDKVPSKDDGDYGDEDKDGYGDKEADKGGGSSKPSSGSCSCSLQCGKGASCFASKCVADDAPAKK